MTSSHPLALFRPGTKLRANGIGTASLLNLVLLCQFLANIYDPGGALGLKYVVFCVTLVCSLWALKFMDLTLGETIAGSLLFVVWPCWSLLFGIVRNGDTLLGVSQVTPFLFGLVLASLLFVLNGRLSLRLLYTCLFSLAIVIIVSFTFMFFLPGSSVTAVLNALFARLHESHEGYFGVKAWGDLEAPGVYFGSTLFLVPTFVYFLFIGKPIRAAIVLLAIALAFSKGGLAISIGFAVVYWVRSIFSDSSPSVADKTRNPKTRVYLRVVFAVALFFGITILIASSFQGFAEDVKDTFSGQSETATLRLRHIDSIFRLWKENPDYLLVGQGVGVPFYTTGESDYVQGVEVDHLNVVRKFGLPWFLGFSAIVFLSARKLILAQEVEMRAFGFALASMYLAAGTNPVLITPMFIMLLTLTYFAQRSGHVRSS
jgi:hypothetical protein